MTDDPTRGRLGRHVHRLDILFVCADIADVGKGLFFFIATAATEIYTVRNTLSLHDALPISCTTLRGSRCSRQWTSLDSAGSSSRSEEHTSELQSLRTISYAVFCLKKKK